MKPRIVVGVIVGIVVAGAAWAVFRPELLVLDKRAADPFPGQSPTATASAPESARALVSGTFHGLAHETRGTATIHELAGGKRVLRLTGFETSYGPDVRVLLVAAGDVPDDETVKSAGSVELGKLKGNVGDQNYEIPTDTDLAKYRSVSIWCQRFGVNFGAAALSGPMAVEPRLPTWLAWFDTPDNSLLGDNNWKATHNGDYWSMVQWLYRNSLYGFKWGPIAAPNDGPRTIHGDPTINCNNGHYGTMSIEKKPYWQWKYVEPIGSTV